MILAGEKEKGIKYERFYLFVAGAFQDMQKPTMNKTKPCAAPEDGSLGKANKSIAARGIADAELVCARIILPEFGRRVESISPILPPNRPPKELPITNRATRNAVFSCEKPESSNHIAENDRADHGNEPVTPCATIIWKDGILITDFAS